MQISGYRIEKQIHTGSKRSYYQARRLIDDEQVIIKTPTAMPISQRDQAQLIHECEILQKVEIKGVFKPSIVESAGEGKILVFGYKSLLSLKETIQSRKMTLQEVLEISISLADTIAELHLEGIIHKDIQPENIFIEAFTDQTWLLDFSIASFLPKENPTILNPDILEGSPAYMSPEQTGRMNRSLDNRTDFYSLGITIYEMLTGRPPFQNIDPLELVHSHLAKQPVPPHQIDPSVPEMVSEIVIKLLAKTAEERYQSAHGLKRDLESCLQAFREEGTIPPFQLGTLDISDTLRISQKLYGRENEIRELLDLFGGKEREQIEMVMVSGYSGVGKTSLVREILRPITRDKGYFVSGKSDQYHQNIPYSLLASAFQDLIGQLLTESEKKLREWKEKILNALGDNAQLIIDIVPNLQLVTGPRQPVKSLNSDDATIRFHGVLIDFIRVFCQREHPLIVFLDDLQWVDSATLKVLEMILSEEELTHLFFIGAYRDNEVDATHPLQVSLNKLTLTTDRIHHISLLPLGADSIGALIGDTFKVKPETVKPLADLVHQKTNGNPFFVNQFLTALYQQKLLFFEQQSAEWKWNISQIEAQGITDNVIDLLIKRLKRISSKTVDMLSMAACIGNRFEMQMLTYLTGNDPAETMAILLPAMKEDMIEAVSGFRLPGEIDMENCAQIESFKFLHDKVYQACYDLTGKQEKEAIHLRIGHVLLKTLQGPKRDEAIFDILAHLNQSIDLIIETEKRQELAELNLLAGRKAKSSAAFDQALAYFKTAQRLLAEECWETQYKSALQIYTECVDAAHICGYFEDSEHWFNTIKQNGQHPLDMVRAYNSKIIACMAQNRLMDGHHTSMEILNALDEPVDEKTTVSEIRQKVDEIMQGLPDGSIEHLADLQEMSLPTKLAAHKILSSMTSVVYIGFPDIWPTIVCKQIELLIKYGNAPDAPFSYAVFGTLLCGLGVDFEAGYRFGQLALSIMNNRNLKECKARVHHVVSGYVNHWKIHVQDSLELALTGYQGGLESGDFEFAGYNLYCHGLMSFLSGKRLDRAAEEMASFSSSIRRLKQETPLRFTLIFYQSVLNLVGDDENPCLLNGIGYDERKMLPLHERAHDRLAILFFNFCKIILCYLFGDYSGASLYARNVESEISINLGGPLPISVFRFYDSLVLLAQYPTESSGEQERMLTKIRNNQEKLKKWAEHAPMNHLHKFYLVEAELAARLGKRDEAGHYYLQAIETAQKNRYINEEAIAHELAAGFRFQHGDASAAWTHLQKACQCYQNWGAVRKIKQLEENYPRLRQTDKAFSGSEKQAAILMPHQAEGGSRRLDLLTMLKTTQAISSEIELDKLLTNLMRIVIENAGAESGLLVLKVQDRLMPAAKGSAAGRQEVLAPFKPLEESADLPGPIVNYVARTKEFIVLNNAAVDGLFTGEHYVRTFKPQSVLCLPIYHKAKMSGILYLENRLAPGVFSTDRLEVLKILMSQIAISIENARLYQARKEAEEKYRGIFENAAEGIFQTTPEGRFISANPASARILGYDSPDELVGVISDIERHLYVNPSERRRLIRLLYEKKWVEGAEVQFKKKDGSHIWVALNIRPVFDADGKLELMEGFFSDITQRKRETDALRVREESLRKENSLLKSNFKDRYKFGDIIGKSRPMQNVYELILKAATINANTIIYGESGTGKELVARAIHDNSDRKNNRFVPVNCGAIPENLLESEFFGYKKGAFTGAHADKEGFLDQADKGTLFLDELGEINISMQAKLLRALEGSGYTPVGGHVCKVPNVRVVAATNKDLQQLVKSGNMREDFFYRVHIIPIHLPALRERKEDIPLLIEHFLKLYGDDQLTPAISGKMLEAIINHDWPGNIRELQNVVHRFVSLNIIDFLEPRDPDKIAATDMKMEMDIQDEASFQSVMETFERKLLHTSLEKNRWQREKTARHLGLPSRTFYRKLKKHGLIQP